MTGTALATFSTTLPAHLVDQGNLGNENLDADTLATPRLYLLQALSDQVVRGNPNYVQGAQAGMFMNSITNELHDELFVSNLFMTRGYNVNKRREFGQKDWKGFHPTIESALAKLQADGVNPQDYDIADTHTHTLVVINPETGEIVTPIQYSLKATGLKESRNWNTTISTHCAGKVPRFAGIWKLSSKLNTNAKGSWYTPQVSFAGWAPEGLAAELRKLFDGLRGSHAIVDDVE